tara:strand:+ start:13389 stop:14333 length:945 start_codon:yes stop_codon:yes gene_type:complete
MSEEVAVAETAEAAPVESAPVESAPVESAPAEAAPVEAAPAEDPISQPIDWNGEIESLKQSEWLSALDPSARDTVLSGVEAKYRNWERGYSKAFQENADRRRTLDEREQEVRSQELRVQRWVNGDVSPLEDKQREIEELKNLHRGALQALRKEHEEAQRRVAEAHSTEQEALREERDKLGAQIKTFEQEATKREEAELQSAVAEFETWINKEAPDIVKNDEAFYTLCVLCTGGVSPEDAVTMVRAKFAPPAPPAPEPEPEPEPQPEVLPKSVELMNMGTGQGAGTEKTERRSYDDIMNEMRLNAMRQEGGILGS